MNSLSKDGKLVKAFTTVTSFATVLSLSGVAYLAPVAALAVAPADYGLTEGNVISAAGSDDPDVYIVNEMGYKRLFLNPAIFNFYGHLGGFAAVKNVSATTRDAFGTSGLFRNCETNDPKVYGVETTGEDTGMLHWVNTTGAQAVADDANFFSKVFCINNNEFNWYAKGSDYTSVSQVPNYTRGTTVVTGPLTVSLASSNPVAGTIVDGQARYTLASFLFSGSSTVTSFKLKRIGVSADASLTNVYLYDGTTRLTDAVTVSDSVLAFNDPSGLFTVSGSRVISVVADIDGTAGETIGVQATEVNDNAISGVSSNLHQIATATLATLTLGAVTPVDSSNNGVDDDNGNTAPESDVNTWQSAFTVGQRYVWLKSLQFRVVGSIASGDVKNFRLFLDGVMVGSAVSTPDANGYVVFDMSGSPVKLETGSRTLKVLADIVGGSSKEFYLSLRQKADVWAIDSQYNAAVLSSTTFPVGDVDNDIEIDTGVLTFTKRTDSPSGDVVKGASGVVLARFDVKATGEKMKVENLHISNDSSSSAVAATNHLALRNAALFLDGVQVGSTTTLWDNDATASDSDGLAEVTLGSSMIVVPGTPRVLEIRADIYDASGTDGTAANDYFTANIETSSTNVQRLTTLDYQTYPSAITSGNQLTIKTGSFTAGKYTGYANQSVVAPKTGVKVGHYTLAAASSEDVTVNTLTIDAPTGAYGNSGTTTSDFTDAYVKVYNDAGTLVYTSPVKATFSVSASNSYSTNFTMPKNKTYQIELWANIASTFVSGTDVFQSNFDAAGTTTGSSTSVTATQVSGQVITSAAGSLTIANGSLPTSKFVNGGLVSNVYNFTLTPAYDDYTVEEVYVDIPSATTASNSGAVSTLYLKSGSTTLATATLVGTTGSASFTGLNLLLPQSGGTKTLSVDVEFAGVGVGANDTAGSVTVRLDGLKFRNSAGTYNVAADGNLNGLSTTTYTGNAFYDVKGYPTFANTALPTSVLSGGSQTLFKTVVSATGGQIAWNDITFSVASSSNVVTIATSSYQLWENGVNITDSAVGAVASDSYISTGNGTYIEFSFATERVVAAGSSVTLELKGTVSGALVAGNSISTKIANPKGTTITSDDSTVQAASGASFVWSDQSATSHATTTDDWFTDALVKTLTETQILAK